MTKSKNSTLAQKGWGVLRNTVLLFQKHDTGTLAAALSYYTIFSLAPVIIIVISIAGVVLGPDAVEGEIRGQIQNLMGAKSAILVQEMIKAAYKPGENIPTAIIAILLLVMGAVGVFGQLRTSLNTIWDVKESAKKPLVTFFLTRLFSFAMVVTMAFLMLVSLVAHAILEGFSHYLTHRFSSISVLLFGVLDNIFSLFITWILFSLIYKFLSDAKLKWKNIWWGALFTAVLFTIGKYLIGLYLGRRNVGDTYGAAGSVVIILVWVFYSSQILFFGAEFTRALANEAGIKLHSDMMKTNELYNEQENSQNGK